MKTIVGLVSLAPILCSASLHAVELFEDFNMPGKPTAPKGIVWSYKDEMLPVKDWKQIVPGDGFAYLTIDADHSNDRNRIKQKWPFQMIMLSPVGPGHRMEMRARNTVISGVASFIFTYSVEDGVVDEIDIEIVGDDAQAPPAQHATGKTGWTDARFNTWANADMVTPEGNTSHKQPILDESGEKTSHQDDQFHIYTIDWHKDSVDFLIDGVQQQTITKAVPNSPATLFVGMRHLDWTGKLDWPGTRTMIVDWIRVKPVTHSNHP